MDVRVGIIGMGRIGQLHANNLINSISNAKLVAIADPYLKNDTIDWAKNIGIEICVKDPELLIQDPRVDAICVCSSTETHAEYIIKSARAGKAIFCEKPIDFNLERISEALYEVQKAGVLLQLGFVRRFDKNHRKVHDTVAKGDIGKPHIIKITSRDPEPPTLEYMKASGGLFMDMMIHDFDMARYLSGSEIDEITAIGSVGEDFSSAGINDISFSAVMMKFKSGAIGLIDNDRKSGYGYDQRTEVQCENGCVLTNNNLENQAIIYSGKQTMGARPTWFFLERYNDAFIAEINSFISAIRFQTKPVVDGEDGLKATIAAKAAELSLKENRTVKISEIVY